jgi:Fungal specific transcription factor domain
MCFELYFRKFHALYPIMHRPTFRITGLNQFLVTAMSVFGALFVGTPAAKIQAGKILRQLNKVVLATV